MCYWSRVQLVIGVTVFHPMFDHYDHIKTAIILPAEFLCGVSNERYTKSKKLKQIEKYFLICSFMNKIDVFIRQKIIFEQNFIFRTYYNNKKAPIKH